jgi:hypothetical protein
MTKYAYKRTGHYAGIIGKVIPWDWQDNCEYVSLTFDRLGATTISKIADLVYCTESPEGWMTEPCKTCTYSGTNICEDCEDCLRWEGVDNNAENS